LKPRKSFSFFDTPFAKAVGFCATVLSFIFSVPTGTTRKIAPAVPAAAIAKAPSTPRLSQTTRKPIIVQSSSGSQNVNLNDVRRDVHIQYSQTTNELSPPTDATAKTELPIVQAFAASGSTTQITRGIQNANISNVGGNVDLQFGPLTAATGAQR
jgi:hypothetical protein